MVEGLDQLIQAVRGLKAAAPDEFCALGVQWWAVCMTKAEWSGWVQAIGSIAAILASVQIVRKSDQQERTRRADAEKQERIDAAVTAAQLASAGLLALSNARIVAKTENQDETMKALSLLNSIVTAMKSIKIGLFTDYTHVEPLVKSIAILSAGLELGDKWALQMGSRPMAGATFSVVSESLDKELEGVVAILRDRAGLKSLQHDMDVMKV